MKNTFASAIANQEARTANDMKARKSTASATVDLFYNIGASRGKNVIPSFIAALVENRDYALRIAQWVRDIRGGSGERQIYRDILLELDKSDPQAAIALVNKTPEIGRWDDLLISFTNMYVKSAALELIRKALLVDKNGLCAKWMPRKGPQAVQLRSFLGLSPKQYRRLLVGLTTVVESQMCAKDWDNINFSHVPSVASSRYKKAFYRNTPAFAEYVAKLVKGDKSVKVNAQAVYPYDVLKGLIGSIVSYMNTKFNQTELDHIQAQWDALPNYVGDANVLPLVDVSGSMNSIVGGKGSSLTALDVSISLGLYCADKNKGKFKDTFLTFSGSPELKHVKGNILQKIKQMNESEWGMNTNLHAAFDKILKTALNSDVPQEEMPDMLLIMSDMQFDSCVKHDDSAIEMIERKYADAGYKLPKVVFWNLNAGYENVPVRFDKSGTALVSGFSPAIMKSLLSNKLENFTAENVMLETIMNPRYDYEEVA